MVFMSSTGKPGLKVLYKYEKRRLATTISHVNIKDSNNWNKSNSNLPHGKVQNDGSFIHSLIYKN